MNSFLKLIKPLTILALASLILSACGLTNKLDEKSLKNQKRIDYLSRALQKKNKQLTKLKTENELLEAHQIRRSKRLDQMQVGKTSKTEEQLYAAAIQSYRERKIGNLVRNQKLLLKNYPNSIYNDNALYLVGRLNLLQKNYSQSLKYFDYVIKLFPKSNKRVSALFYKGVAYRKLRLGDQARKQFKEVNRIYPGSPESFKTKLELRLLELQTRS